MALTQVKAAGIAADAIDETKLADNSIDSEHYNDGSIDTAHIATDAINYQLIADNTIGLNHIQHGTDGQILTFDANGAPAYVGPGTDGQVLTSTGAGSPPAFENASGGISDVVSDTSPQLGGDLETNGHNILLGDSSNGADDDVIRIGAGQDLNLYHDGTNSWIVNKTGNLNFYAKHGEYACRMIPDGAVELYHNNVKKVETTAEGMLFDGTGGDTYWLDNSDGNGLKWRYTDNVKGCYGTSDDLAIYHDGTDNFLDQKTGYLRIRDVANSREIAKFHSTNSQEFYMNGTKRLEVTNTGISVTGSATLSGGLYVGGTGGSNYMDDYEEGTWTPADGGGIVSFANQDGTYVKVGNMVMASFRLICTTSVTSTGSAYMVGLPFTSINSATPGGMAISYTNSTDDFRTAHVNQNTTQCNFYKHTGANMTRAQMWDGASTSKQLSGTLCYLTD